MDPFFGSDPMLSQYLEHRSTRKTAYTFPHDALEPVVSTAETRQRAVAFREGRLSRLAVTGKPVQAWIAGP
jgi:hypothetical protein